jgi:hypothetical protein
MTGGWYVVCRFTATETVAGEAVLWPASVAHAKRMGGTQTACGQTSTTWARLFHVAFPVARTDNCPACLDVVTQGGHGFGERRGSSARTRLS